MLAQLKYLWPDFSLLLNAGNNTNAISAWFWVVTCGIFVVSLYFVLMHFWRFRRRIAALRGLVDGQSNEQLAAKRRETLHRAQTLKVPGLGSLWKEFDESLVMSADQSHLYNTLDAEHFFNAQTLAGGLTGSRLLAAAPSFLVAIGVLGTFVGLTVGLEGLVSRMELSGGDTQALTEGINKLIAGAAVAFMTSVWGVLFSLALNFIEKEFERRALGSIRALQHDIDTLYPRIPAEQSLVHIADYTRESKEALQELHERIGNRLQEAVTGMSETFQQAIIDALNNVMAPALQSLVQQSSNQSTQVLSTLVERFMQGMSSAGREQGDRMQQAASDVNAAMAGMTERLNVLFSSLDEKSRQQVDFVKAQNEGFGAQLERIRENAEQQQGRLEQRFSELLDKLGGQMQSQLNAADQREAMRQQAMAGQLDAMNDSQHALLQEIARSIESSKQQGAQMAVQHEALVTQLQRAAEASETSAKHLDNTSLQLGVLAKGVKDAATALAENITEVTTSIDQLASENMEIAAQVRQQAEQLTQLQGGLQALVTKLDQTTGAANQGFADLSKHQEVFLQGVKNHFTALATALREQVENIAEQSSVWLEKYSTEVNRQTEHRLSEWNHQTQAFSTQMHNAVKAISSIVDELEAR